MNENEIIVNATLEFDWEWDHTGTHRCRTYGVSWSDGVYPDGNSDAVPYSQIYLAEYAGDGARVRAVLLQGLFVVRIIFGAEDLA